MHFSSLNLFLAALCLERVACQPAHHRHRHNYKRVARPVDFNDKNLYKDVNFSSLSVDWSAVTYTAEATGSPTATASSSPGKTSSVQYSTLTLSPLPASTAASSASIATSSASASKPNEEQKPEDKEEKPEDQTDASERTEFGGRTEPIDDGDKDHYMGNRGIPFGSNMMFIPESKKDDYKYTMSFTNQDEKEITVVVWNKSGPDGQEQSGMSLPPVLTFKLKPGGTRYVAFDENSQIAFSQDCERDPKRGNIRDCTWGEADYGDLRNKGWSGYNRSSIPNSKGNVGLLTITCDVAETSSKEENSFTHVDIPYAGGVVVPGPAAFQAFLGS